MSRSRARPANEASASVSAEAQLIKAHPADAAGSASADPRIAAPPEMPASAPLVPPLSPVTEIRREPAPEPRFAAGLSGGRPAENRGREGNGILHRDGAGDREPQPTAPSFQPTPRPAAGPPQANGDQRPKLHLSLGNGSQVPTNGGGHATEAPPYAERHQPPNSPHPANHQPVPHQGAGERITQRPFEGLPRGNSPAEQGRYGRDFGSMPEAGAEASPRRNDADPARRKDNGTFIDQELRTRVDGDIAAFLAAFDAALAEDTQQSRFGLREATDRLLRAGARTRIELERLEARVPLSPRNAGGQPDPAAWRHR